MQVKRLFYFTLIFFPARMLFPFIPLSWRSFFTVVWCLSAISDNVSPLLTVTLFFLVLERLDDFLFLLLLLL